MGRKHQVKKMIEEAWELIEALQSEDFENGVSEELKSEMADCYNTLAILSYGLGIRDDILKIQNQKLDDFFAKKDM